MCSMRDIRPRVWARAPLSAARSAASAAPSAAPRVPPQVPPQVPLSGAVGGAIGTPIVNAINGPRSFKLWYTAAKPGYTDFTSPQDTDTGFGVTDPPSLAVSGNKLYCVHQGHGSNGEIWWFNVDGDKRSGDGKLNGSTASPPALAEFNGELYCVYQRAGADGYMGWTKLPITSPAAAPGPNAAWVEAKGANSYLYHRLDNTATGGAAVTQTKTVTIDSGASTPRSSRAQSQPTSRREQS
jgi:hypothetical protein